jgi:hypothetical protein
VKATTFAIAPAMVQKLLDEVIYESVVEAIDFDALHRIEQMLAMTLLDLGQIEPDKAVAAATMMIERAWQRLADDPRRRGIMERSGMDCELCAAAETHGS